jgi:two-component system chemotaxis response regulator CheY
MKILIVDDEIVSRIKAQTILSEIGKCDAAASGNEALEAFHLAHDKGQPYDLITMDIEMAGMDGISTLENIREWEQSHNIQLGKGAKVLMLTGHRTPDTVLSSFGEGCEGYVVKPVTEAKLRVALANLGYSKT